MALELKRWAWQRLRLLRAEPPGLAENSKPRSRVFTAALEQAEALTRAAETVGPAAQPLLLFYAISQAARAVTAAHVREHWELSGHGLLWLGDSGSKALDRLVRPDPADASAFQRLADGVYSDGLRADVELGALWHALPDLEVPVAPSKPEWLKPLRMTSPAVDHDIILEALDGRVVFLVDGLGVRTPQAIADQLRHYPSAADGVPDTTRAPNEFGVTERWSGGAWAPQIIWQASGPTLYERQETLDRVAPLYRSDTFRAAIPRLPTGDHLKPLVLWWALLFGLSNMARYEPDNWVKALALNSSRIAVPLEAAMTEALDAIPHLVLEALLQRQVPPLSY
jgi:hypothetical protein